MNEQCPICIEDLPASDKDKTWHVLAGCGHVMHLQCHLLWFSSNSTCPVCRTDVVCTGVRVQSTRGNVALDLVGRAVLCPTGMFLVSRPVSAPHGPRNGILFIRFAELTRPPFLYRRYEETHVGIVKRDKKIVLTSVNPVSIVKIWSGIEALS